MALRVNNFHNIGCAIAALTAVLAAVLLTGCASTEPAPVLDRTTPVKPPPAVVAAKPEPVVVAKPEPGVGAGAGVVVTPLPSGDGAGSLYTVKPGDTLFSIAKANGKSVRDLAAWNNIEDPSNISVGQQLRLTAPAGAVTATPVKPPSIGAERPAVVETPTVADPNFKTQPLGQRVPYSEQAYAQMKGAGVAKPDVRADAKADARTEVKLEPVPERKPAAKVEAPRADANLDWAWPAEGKVIGNFNESSNKGITISGKRGQPVHASAAGRVIYSGAGIRGLGKLVVIRHNRNYQTVYAHNDTLLVKEGQNVTKGQPIAEMGNSDADQVKLHFEIRHQGRPVDPIKLLPAT